ncbi:MAG TPA: tetratricopeptide repeat protein [Planctomycetota bacterium]|nr:tetratricopeptide repeat protein [Planctomycetota bacterium]
MNNASRPTVLFPMSLVLALICSLSVPLLAADTDDAVAWGRENIAAGKYAEAEEMLRKALPNLEGAKKRDATLVLIEALRIVGKLKEAHELCDGLLKSEEKDPVLRSLKAELLVETGEYVKARDIFDALISEKPDNLRAWALRSNIYRLLSDSSGLKKTADYFFDLYQKNAKYYNSDQVKDPLELAYIGLGFQDENPKDAFETGFLLAEELCTDRGLMIPEVFLWSARLAHAKYHFAFASERYGTVAKMRPKYPDALAGQADIILQTMHKLDDVEKLLKEALSVNPNHVESNLLSAAVHLEEDRYDDAKKHIDAALSVNPNDFRALAMLAFYHLDLAQPEKAAEVEKRVLAMNPKCADFYCEIGELMENKRGFNTAPAYYEKAIKADPDYWRGYYGLGMNTSRQGAHGEEKGKELLLKAFGKNKFNVWAKNMLVSLDKLLGDKEQEVKPVYVESRTKHFILKFHNKDAAIVRPYLEEWAEAAYEAQVKKFGYEPEGPLTIELCYNFQDQAARTVGLPNLGALGVCFGKLCTVVSPREGKGSNGNHPPFNWRKVLEHEFAHVMALQLSEFRVPRWYTEAMSTFVEDDSRIQSDRMMIDAIAKGRLKNIDTMNEYFRINPLMAYVHGRYVIEYIDKNFGFDAHIKALKLFAKGKKLNEALKEATGKELAELNAGQLEFLKKSFEDVRLRPTYDPATLVKLELATKKDDATAQDIANFAIAMLAGRRYDQAEALAKQALEKDANSVDALNVLGSIAYEKKDYERARQHYLKSTGLDPKRSFAAWHRLGVIYKKEGKTTKAIEAFEAARKSYPRYIGPDNPHHELPDLYADLEPAQMDKALGVWKDAVKINSEDAEAALKGLRLAMKIKDYAAAAEFTMAHIQIDPYNAEVHRLGGKAFEELKDAAKAEREYRVAVALDDKDVESWVGLARMQKASGKREEALLSVQRALEIDGTHAEAKSLRDSLK